MTTGYKTEVKKQDWMVGDWMVGDLAKCVSSFDVSNDDAAKRYASGELKANLKVGDIYEVTEVSTHPDGEQFISVVGNGTSKHGTYGDMFTKVKSKQIHMKITNLVKKILDSDTRTLVKAGFINGDLALTEEGSTELLGILFLEKKIELVKIANEKLDETK